MTKINLDPKHHLILIAQSAGRHADPSLRFGLAVELEAVWHYFDGWQNPNRSLDGAFEDVVAAAGRWEKIFDDMGHTSEIVRRGLDPHGFSYIPDDLLRELLGKRLGVDAAFVILDEVSGRAQAHHLCAWIRLHGLAGQAPMRHADLAALYGCSPSGVGTWTRRVRRWIDIAERRELNSRFARVIDNDHSLDACLRHSPRPLCADILSEEDWITILSEADREATTEAIEARIKAHETKVVRPAWDGFKRELDAMIDDAVAEALAEREMIPLNKVIHLIRTRRYET